MGEPSTVLKAIAAGAAFPAVVVAIAASAPLVNDQFITPIDGRILTVAWWFMVSLGVALTVIRGRRLWPGTVVGLLSVAGFQVSMVLLMTTAERAEALWSPTGWLTASFAIVMPWAIGMAFGWSSVQGRPRRLDGGPGPDAPADRA